MKHLKIISLMLTLLGFLGCETPGRNVKIGEPFDLKSKESATVQGAGIKITLNRIDEIWGVNPNAGAELSLNFSVNYNGHTEIYNNLQAEDIIAGDYKIEILKTAPAEGYANFVVNELKKPSNPTDEAAAKFVEQFGWHLDLSAAPEKVSLNFPKNFDGLPFNLYQSVSINSGVDMTPLLGKTVEMLKYKLREKEYYQQKVYLTYAHLIIEEGKVAGAWRTDSSARAPGIYSFVKR